jgi:hypothetical protein
MEAAARDVLQFRSCVRAWTQSERRGLLSIVVQHAPNLRRNLPLVILLSYIGN